MNDKTKKPNREPVTPEQVDDSAFAEEMAELKRDMRSAKVVDWAQNNQQLLIAGVVAVLLVLVGGTFWVERNQSQNESAAMLYHQAISATGDERMALLEIVTKDYADSGYASLAHLQMAKVSDSPEDHLKALIYGSASTQELAWQARLDLAELYLGSGKSGEAKALLVEAMGRQYEQLRHYLLAEVSTDATERRKHLQMSLDSISNDALLKSRVESMLSELGSGDATGASSSS